MFVTGSFYKRVKKDMASRVHHKKLFASSFVFLFLTYIFTSLHYRHDYYGNNFTWIFWLLSIALFISSLVSPTFKLKRFTSRTSTRVFAVFLLITGLYWITHLINFNIAPWNLYGLFDDAAWDIYFAGDKIFTDIPFQAAFFDQVGYISRETIFHYYITIFFEFFGYNLLSFNFSLLLLGYVTVIFTTLIIHKLFNNMIITVVMGIVINFFPLHYMHIFMGHRYAITAPLMVVSIYFLHSAYFDNSAIKSSLSALFAALCWGSAIMGKQYILGLVMTVFLILTFNHKVIKLKRNITITIIWIVAFVISTTPLILYIFYNSDAYFGRERDLLNEFIVLYKHGGIIALEPYYSQVKDLFFKEINYRRQFLHDFPIIPMSYYLLLMPGLFFAYVKRRFEIVILSLIPILSIFLSGAYDFRLLIAAPVWVITMAYSLHFAYELKPGNGRQTLMSIIFVLLFVGIVPSVIYIFEVSKDPNHIYLLRHKDVAVSRMIQDIASGEASPSIEMKHNEFNRENSPDILYDTMACPQSAYAVAHLYLQRFDDKKVLSLCGQGIQLLKTPSEILEDNYEAISNYANVGRDLKLVWEISEKSKVAIMRFDNYKKYGSEIILNGSIDNSQFSLYVLTINSENIGDFKRDTFSERHEI